MESAGPEKSVLVCASCGATLSTDLDQLTDPGMLSLADGTQLLPDGLWCFASASIAEEYCLAVAGQWLVSKASTTNLVPTHLLGRQNGCCGFDGCDGPNLLCARCNSEVATERSDCWMAHSIAFHPQAVHRISRPLAIDSRNAKRSDA